MRSPHGRAPWEKRDVSAPAPEQNEEHDAADEP
jgi:hypothetical protein